MLPTPGTGGWPAGGSLLRLGSHPLGAVIHLKHFEGMLKQGKPIKVQAVMAEMANLTKAPGFVAEEKKWMVDEWQDVEDWSAVFLTFTDGTKATVFANDTTLGGVVNTVDIYLSNSIVKCKMSGMGACEVYAPAHDIFGDEYLQEKQETKAGWSLPAPDEDWMAAIPRRCRISWSASAKGESRSLTVSWAWKWSKSPMQATFRRKKDAELNCANLRD